MNERAFHFHAQKNCITCGDPKCSDKSHFMTEDEREGME